MPNVDDPYARIARYYDTVARADHRDIERFAELAQERGGPVLDIATGTGRVAVALAVLGVDVVGLDRSAAMLAVARSRAEAARVRVEWVQADMTEVALDRRFGLIVCAADSFLHLNSQAQQLAALRRCRALLAPGGMVALDLPAPDAPGWGDWAPGVRPLELAWSGLGPSGGLLQHFVSYTADASAQTRHVTHLFDEIDERGVVRRTVSEFTLRFVFPAELELLAERVELRLVSREGGYDAEPFAAGCERMLAVLKTQP